MTKMADKRRRNARPPSTGLGRTLRKSGVETCGKRASKIARHAPNSTWKPTFAPATTPSKSPFATGAKRVSTAVAILPRSTTSPTTLTGWGC
jgi:hypothetical protein